MSVESSLLGQDTEYPTQYAPQVLFPIARAPSRESYTNINGITQGMDWWHIFEISWLNEHGIPQVALGRLHIPATSEYLIESKSLKLYFNSFNFEKLSRADFIRTVEKDLSSVAQANIKLQLLNVDELHISQPQGICLDLLQPTKIEFEPNASLLALDDNNHIVEQSFYSHLLRSNCPVTNQPDWGTVFIRYQGKKISEHSLLAYIISYRKHNGFHEQCVEHIFADIWQHLQPEKLMVYAAYTRRGGLDINPCRVSDPTWLPQPIRLARQ
ncbi:NADPH-dependent 7-cyano-7-deazaguanine reductase QueF [Acinetobacter qingfengensis]|uniref:NADPH-dependent 7-cyano-7-deazaguanine reductase QueF n=1 Tax=Acinetobacter qingfengensis TaxID=1262585 RepID=A0A1E7REK3_9GAMM|nr:NADPH-dependent 7-cyano-7-deazaguanine reductase QueF [Acinetobacter qingfengensis]KAA8735004.1 NADPH-dependent 7-cyano-7-deazaguanine reductase QueF [Acinetobacter qingfengensis]OEY97726.1 NADPH-dependent 7-cyano-7-deazaguanine reductase QueF [Acinetobacter qingfengensis]